MTNVNAQIEKMVMAIDEDNAKYILKYHVVKNKIGSVEFLKERGMNEKAEEVINEIKKIAEDFGNHFISPSNAKVGDGVTMHLYSDAYAGTVVKVTKSTVTVQKDKATLDPNWKPEMVAGGFAGHCTNQNEQTYTYERNENGETVTFRWSDKYEGYRNNKMGYVLTKGRREFYDYNY